MKEFEGDKDNGEKGKKERNRNVRIGNECWGQKRRVKEGNRNERIWKDLRWTRMEGKKEKGKT